MEYNNLLVKELQGILRDKKLQTTGKKAELIQRLEENDTKRLQGQVSISSSGISSKQRKRKSTPSQTTKSMRKTKKAKSNSDDDVYDDMNWNEMLLSNSLLNKELRPQQFYLSALSTVLSVVPLCKIVQEYIPDHLSMLESKVDAFKARNNWRIKAKTVLPTRGYTAEALALLCTVREGQREIICKTKKKRKKGQEVKTRTVGYGLGVLAGALKGSMAQKVRQAGISTTFGQGAHVPAAFWSDLLKLLEKHGFVTEKTCHFAYGSGSAYTISEKGLVALQFVQWPHVLQLLQYDAAMLTS